MRGLATALVLVGLLCPAFGRQAAAQTAEAPVAGAEVTIKGPLLSTLHLYLEQGPKFVDKDAIPVLYAFDGTPEVKATLEEILKTGFPEEGLNLERALELQKQCDAKLKYYLDLADKSKKVVGYCSVCASVTGTVQEKDGKKWIVNAKVSVENVPGKYSFRYPPDVFLKPDKPFVMPKEAPVVLKIDDKLTLTCMPIPPGSFLMGSPFYQSPRYQDEHPMEVTLTKLVYMSEIPVTQDMWESVMGPDKNFSRYGKGPQYPVEYAPFPDIRQFCKTLSEKNGRTVRLPTAAEYEYAERLGTSNPNFAAKYVEWVNQVGSTDRNGKPTPVKTKKPNAWGFYDLLSNGEEAVGDWKAYNQPGKYNDPQGVPLKSSISCASALKPQKPVEGMIMYRNLPGVHKAVGGHGGPRPGYHTRYAEDGCDGGNGTGFVGIFRVVVESGPAATPTPLRGK